MDLKVVLSYIHPFWHDTVVMLVMVDELSSRWYWGFANIWQELRVPSSRTGILTTSLSSRDKFLKPAPSSREVMSQWWEGITAIKLFSRKWNGKEIRGIINVMMRPIWNFPKPSTSASTLSNFILIGNATLPAPAQKTIAITTKNTRCTFWNCWALLWQAEG